VADWVAISSLATAGGTLALAATTYASVRSANRAARTAELSLLAAMRPLLVESFDDDRALRVNFKDVAGINVPGGGAAVEIIEDNIYIVTSLRNVGTGIAVLHGGYVYPERRVSSVDHVPLQEFRRMTRDLYIPPGDVGYWQIAFRADEDNEEMRAGLLSAIEGGYLSVDVLYGDYEGGQRVISRYGLGREERGWQLATIRHWQIDREDVRPRED
jgi:hypothetical protein